MCPASAGGDLAGPVPFQFLIGNVPITYDGATEAFKKLLQMICLTRLPVIIENDRMIILLVTAVYPHATFGACLASIFTDLDRGLICMNDSVCQQFCLQSICHQRQISFRQSYHPVCHHLSRKIQSLSTQFLLDPVKRQCVHIFRIHDPGCKRRCSYAVGEKLYRVLRSPDLSIFPMVNSDVMLQNSECGRMVFQRLVHLIREPVITIRKQFRQFILRDLMCDHFYRICRQICIFLSGALSSAVGDLLNGRFFCFFRGECFCFVKCFSNEQLISGQVFLCGTTESDCFEILHFFRQKIRDLLQALQFFLLRKVHFDQFTLFYALKFFSGEVLVLHIYILSYPEEQKKPFRIEFSTFPVQTTRLALTVFTAFF